MLRAFASFIQSGLDIILPRKERVVRIERYSPEDMPVSPQEHEACDVRIVTLMRYHDTAVEDCIRALKYDGSAHAAKLLAAALAEYLREEIGTLKLFSTKSVILVPVPLHPSRLRERGFNQIERVLDALPQEFQSGSLARVEKHTLTRVRATPQQTRLSRAERLQNVAGAFELAAHIENTHVILIDDVTTTGATLSEAAKPLRNESAMLLALTRA